MLIQCCPIEAFLIVGGTSWKCAPNFVFKIISCVLSVKSNTIHQEAVIAYPSLFRHAAKSNGEIAI